MSSFVSKQCKKMSLPMKDGKKDLVIEIAAVDLRKAERKHPAKCAFACAATRGVEGVVAAYFYRTTAWLQFENRMERFILSAAMQQAVRTFDRTAVMSMGQYTLLAPRASNLMTRVRVRNAKRKGRHYPRGTDIRRNFVRESDDVRIMASVAVLPNKRRGLLDKAA